MIKTVLVPTDFCVASLNVLKSLLKNSPEDCKYHIILAHGYRLPDGISQLLFFSKSKAIEGICDKQFDEACTILKNKFCSQILSVRKDIFTGYNHAAFRNYIEANEITEAFIPSDYTMNLAKQSFDILPYIKKSSLKVTSVVCGADSHVPEQGSLADLFFSPSGMSISEHGIPVKSIAG